MSYTLTNRSASVVAIDNATINPGSSKVVNYLGPSSLDAIQNNLVSCSPAITNFALSLVNNVIGSGYTADPNGYIWLTTTAGAGYTDLNFATLANCLNQLNNMVGTALNQRNSR